jgi:hypothetical protein
VTISKVREESMFGNSVGLCVYRIGVFFFLVKKLATSGHAVDVSLPKKITRILGNSELVGQGQKTPFVVRPITREKMLEASHWTFGG